MFVLGVAGQHPLERHVVFAEQLGAATRLVGDREHPVDVRVVPGDIAELVLHELAHAGRAVHSRDHRYIIAGADPPVVSKITVEVPHLVRRIERNRPNIGADFILLLEVSHRHVLGVDVVAHRDVRGGEPDGLPVAADRLPGAPRPPRDLVARLDVLPHLDAATRVLEDGAGGDLLLGYGDVVLGLQDDRHVRDRVRRHVWSLLSLSPEGRGQGEGWFTLPSRLPDRQAAPD